MGVAREERPLSNEAKQDMLESLGYLPEEDLRWLNHELVTELKRRSADKAREARRSLVEGQRVRVEDHHDLGIGTVLKRNDVRARVQFMIGEKPRVYNVDMAMLVDASNEKEEDLKEGEFTYVPKLPLPGKE